MMEKVEIEFLFRELVVGANQQKSNFESHSGVID